MTRARTIAVTRMLRYRCARCLAGPGTWCIAATGAPAGDLHAARFYAATSAGDLPLTDAGLDQGQS